jgi:hypothetical protein
MGQRAKESASQILIFVSVMFSSSSYPHPPVVIQLVSRVWVGHLTHLTCLFRTHGAYSRHNVAQVCRAQLNRLIDVVGDHFRPLKFRNDHLEIML